MLMVCVKVKLEVMRGEKDVRRGWRKDRAITDDKSMKN